MGYRDGFTICKGLTRTPPAGLRGQKDAASNLEAAATTACSQQTEALPPAWVRRQVSRAKMSDDGKQAEADPALLTDAAIVDLHSAGVFGKMAALKVACLAIFQYGCQKIVAMKQKNENAPLNRSR